MESDGHDRAGKRSRRAGGAGGDGGAEETAPKAARAKKFRLLRYGLHAATLAGIVYAGTKYISGDAFVRAARGFDWRLAPVICLLSLAYVLVKGWRFVGMMREISDAPRGLVLRAYVAGQAMTLLPGGVAARAALLAQTGIPAAETAAPVALSSLADQALFVVLSLVAALWFEDARGPALGLLGGLVAASVLLGMEATRAWLFGLVSALMRRLMGPRKWRASWHDFSEAMRRVATPARIGSALTNTALAFAFLIAALYLAVRGAGGTVAPTTLLLAFALPTLLGRISALPGGVGVTEAGMMGILEQAPGMTREQAAVAVTVYRTGTVLFSALVGALVYLLSWRRHARAAAAAAAIATTTALPNAPTTDPKAKPA